MTRKLIPALVLALTLPAAAAFASGSAVDGDVAAKIRTTLQEQGYEVRKIKSEDGLYEAYVLKDGKKMEIYLDSDMNTVRVKTDD